MDRIGRGGSRDGDKRRLSWTGHGAWKELKGLKGFKSLKLADEEESALWTYVTYGIKD